MLKAVIFDMDGVLIDSEPVHLEAFRMMIEDLGVEFDREYYLQFIGSTTEHMWDKIIKDFGITLSKEELMNRSDENVGKIIKDKGYPVMPGIQQLVRSISEAGIKLAVASSSGMARIIDTLDKLQIRELFDCTVSGEQVVHPKPAPDTFLKAAELLKVSPSECIVVEDSLNGMKAAKNAGMICVMYESDNSLPKIDSTYADYIIQGYEELDVKYFEMIYAHASGEP